MSPIAVKKNKNKFVMTSKLSDEVEQSTKPNMSQVTISSILSIM